ncbi:Trimethyllysine dioxygenase [Rhizopogon vinicolor AM-OR11-026]|uniref:trimethyllysine dioxygenase n=1 Tax=Rhizopogon vinicolor AM-OR11-026 TaxID=1314800 RepID=A0A1B7NB28_9AGAM|nr:Trimethyllysine dioxygenase [Rhizopogon vinicolor AM-OR11-026]
MSTTRYSSLPTQESLDANHELNDSEFELLSASDSTTVPGAYDTEQNHDYDPPPPCRPISLHDIHIGNADEQLSSSSPGTTRLRLSCAARAILPTYYTRVPTDESEVRTVASSRGTQNDVVLSNAATKPASSESVPQIQAEDSHADMEPEEIPRSTTLPRYTASQTDNVHPNSNVTTTLASASRTHTIGNVAAFKIVGVLPLGSILIFVMNAWFSYSFGIVGFFITYLLHTTHAAECGSIAGLGLWLFRYGTYSFPVTENNLILPASGNTTVAAANDNVTTIYGLVATLAPSNSTDSGKSEGVLNASRWQWLSFLLAAFGGALIFLSLVGVCVMERGSALASEACAPQSCEGAARDTMMRQTSEQAASTVTISPEEHEHTSPGSDVSLAVPTAEEHTELENQRSTHMIKGGFARLHTPLRPSRPHHGGMKYLIPQSARQSKACSLLESRWTHFSLTGSRSISSAALREVVSSVQLGVTQPKVHSDIPIANADERKVSILWSPQSWSRFHNIWLRDHCRCPDCFHPITKQRLFNSFEIPPDIKPIHVQGSTEGLEVVWPGFSTETHSSVYPWDWLQANAYDRPLHTTPNRKVIWGSKIEKSPPSVTYTEVMDDGDKGLYKWLVNVVRMQIESFMLCLIIVQDKFGFCFVSGVPATPEATEELCHRIGFIRETQYGKFWEFTADLSKGDTAYTTMALGAHTDNTYFTDPSGIQLFHLLSHTEGSGGATLLVDGFYVADLMRELYPKFHELLSRVPIPAHAAGEPYALYTPSPPAMYPPLRYHPSTGELIQVRWNNDDRSVMNHLAPDEVEEWYEAIRIWNTLLTKPDSEYWVQLSPGTVLTVDNHRVLHGRSAFDGKRRVCGAYIGMDEYRSKFAVLKEKFEDTQISIAVVNLSFRCTSSGPPESYPPQVSPLLTPNGSFETLLNFSPPLHAPSPTFNAPTSNPYATGASALHQVVLTQHVELLRQMWASANMHLRLHNRMAVFDGRV